MTTACYYHNAMKRKLQDVTKHFFTKIIKTQYLMLLKPFVAYIVY